MDDCSTDQTLEVAKRYKDPRIKVIQKSLRGGPENLHASYNAALHIARGDLVAVLEGDDYWPPDKLALQVPFHQNDSIVLSWGGYCLRSGDRLAETGTRYNRKPLAFPDTSYLLVRNIIPAVTVVASKAALLRIGGFWQPRGTVFVDHPTWLRLSNVGQLLYLPQILGVYRIHQNQISQVQRDRISFQNYSYANEFMTLLNQGQMQRVDLQEIQALRSAFSARDSLRAGNLGMFFRQLVVAFHAARGKSIYRCLKVLVYAPDLP